MLQEVRTDSLISGPAWVDPPHSSIASALSAVSLSDAVWLTFHGGSGAQPLSFADAFSLAGRWARSLREGGVRPGDRVAILQPNGPGYVGPRLMEATQTLHHLFTGRYLAYADARTLELGRSTMAAGALIDPGSRDAFGSWLGWVARDPRRALERQHFQSIMFIQPVDVLADGRQNMCDGCPDITVHEGELVWSCRLEERLQYGNFLRTVPKAATGS